MIYKRNAGASIHTDDGKFPTKPISHVATREQLEHCSDGQLKHFLEERGLIADYFVTRKMMIDILMVID